MISPLRNFCLFFTALVLFPVTITAQHPGEFDTWWEKSGYNETPRYEATIAYCKKLADVSPLITYQVFGQSPQGRDIPLLILDRDGMATPDEVDRSGRIKVLIQACIHAGEPEGKDAGLALFRDIAINHKALDLDSITILFIPIFNVDGHERFTPYSRINQNGPVASGWRTSSTNLNLNRDYLKADSPEMQAWLKLFSKWDPDFFIDCHTTDGADYQYPITIDCGGYMNNPLNEWLTSTYVPELTDLMEKSDYPVFNYVSFRKWHDPRSGLVDYLPGPRFSTGYVTARNRFSLLIETHMLKNYKTRVQGTYHAIAHTLSIVSDEKHTIQSILREADVYTASEKFRSAPCLLESTPDMHDSVMVKFHGIDYTVVKSDLTGGNWFKYGNKPVDFMLPKFGSQLPVIQVDLPAAYLIPAEWQEIISRLDLHGIRYDLLADSARIPVETYRFSVPKWGTIPYEGRQLLESFRIDTVHIERAFSKGSAVVRTDQPLARLVAFMFEPQTEESFLRWGFFNAIFEEKEYVESYVMEKMAREMIQRDPSLKEQFERFRAANPDVTRDSYAQLRWFYNMTPYYDQSVGLYPVGKIKR